MYADEGYVVAWSDPEFEVHLSRDGGDAFCIFAASAVSNGAHERMMARVSEFGYANSYDHGAIYAPDGRSGLTGWLEFERFAVN